MCDAYPPHTGPPPPLGDYSVWFRHNGEMVQFVSDKEEEYALNFITYQTQNFGMPGARYEVRDSNGKVIHRIDVEMVYTVNPDE